MRASKTLAFGLAILAPLAYGQTSKETGSLRIWHSASRPAQQADVQHFTGAVLVEPLFEPVAPSHITASLVTFDSGARTAWHTHPLGQWLFITSGEGRVQAWGEPIQAIRRGDVVWIPAGQKHWHGARLHLLLLTSLRSSNPAATPLHGWRRLMTLNSTLQFLYSRRRVHLQAISHTLPQRQLGISIQSSRR